MRDWGCSLERQTYSKGFAFLLCSSDGSYMFLLVCQHLHSCNSMVVMIHTHAADLSTLPVSVFWVSSSPLLLQSQRRTLHWCLYRCEMHQKWTAAEVNLRRKGGDTEMWPLPGFLLMLPNASFTEIYMHILQLFTLQTSHLSISEGTFILKIICWIYHFKGQAVQGLYCWSSFTESFIYLLSLITYSETCWEDLLWSPAVSISLINKTQQYGAFPHMQMTGLWVQTVLSTRRRCK